MFTPIFKSIAALLLIILLLCGCSKDKNKTCYECVTVTGGSVLKENVCTEDGKPEEKLPQYGPNGQLGWECKKK